MFNKIDWSWNNMVRFNQIDLGGYNMIVTKENPFGQIVSISGTNIVIEINKDILQRNLEQQIVVGSDEIIKLFVGTVGDIFLIGNPSSSNQVHYGIFEEIKLVTEYEEINSELPVLTNNQNSKAVAVGKVIGYQENINSSPLKFNRGVGHYPRFNSQCYLLSSQEKRQMFSLAEEEGIKVGKVPGAHGEEVFINIDKFLGKHSVIFGSTGSGKSCTVASILQKVTKQYKYSHIVFFDLHNEYSSAFESDDYDNKVLRIAANDFKLPYWLLNFEEFLNIFLGDIDITKNGDGLRIVKEQVINLKEKDHEMLHDTVGEIERININTPLFFNIDELISKLRLLNKQTIWKSDGEIAWNEDKSDYLANTGSAKIERVGHSEKDSVLQDQSYYGKLTQVIEKLNSIRYDQRFNFLFDVSYDKSLTLIGYLMDLLSIPQNSEQKQLTILDLSRIPSEITPTIIGMLSRLCFEFKIWDKDPKRCPLYLVFEEAHNYIPKETSQLTKLSKKYIERISKEGRKYGISQLIISQRPSDLSSTIVSQCSNFFVLRVTNPDDQAFIKHVLPDHLSALTNMIPFFQNGEALIAGECVPLPIKAIIEEPNPYPNSHDVSFSTAWSNLLDYDMHETIYRWWDVKDHE